jgi:hypothetical protein
VRLDRKDRPVSRVRLVLQVLRALLEPQVQPGPPDLKAHKARLVLLA